MTYGDWSSIAISLQFENGAVGTMLGSYDSSYAYPDSQLVEVNGTSGRLMVHDTVREFVLQGVGDPVERRWRAGYFDDEARDFHATFDRHVDQVLAAFRSGAEPPVHARAGRRALQLAMAVIESHETGRIVAVGG
jgi:predicted dehydrogenase